MTTPPPNIETVKNQFFQDHNTLPKLKLLKISSFKTITSTQNRNLKINSPSWEAVQVPFLRQPALTSQLGRSAGTLSLAASVSPPARKECRHSFPRSNHSWWLHLLTCRDSLWQPVLVPPNQIEVGKSGASSHVVPAQLVYIKAVAVNSL